jgi:hypothetical protein
MRRVFKTRHFHRWMRKTELTDDVLCRAVTEMAKGLLDADLGGSIYKKRVGLPGRGKRGGARTLIATNLGTRWFFLFGFEKNERDNITYSELQGLQQIAQHLLASSAELLGTALQDDSLTEICHDLDQI